MFALYSWAIARTGIGEYLIFIAAFSWLQVVIWMFNSKRWYFKAIAVASNLNLLFVVFLPKHLKAALRELKTKEGT
jgi:hypothetical protein